MGERERWENERRENERDGRRGDKMREEERYGSGTGSKNKERTEERKTTL